jgi:hypothetical protein
VNRATLQAITGWQADRRRALLVLQDQQLRARRADDWQRADALMFASIDVEDALRERASYAIEESTEMRWVHQPTLRAAA